MGEAVDPPVVVPASTRLEASPTRPVIVRVPRPVSEALDGLVAAVNDAEGERLAVRSSVAGVLVLRSPHGRRQLHAMFRAYSDALVDDFKVTTGGAPNELECHSHPPGPRMSGGRVAVRFDTRQRLAELPHEELRRPMALVMPYAISERIDWMSRQIAIALGAGRGPWRKDMLSASIHAGARDFRAGTLTVGELALAVDGYKRATRVRRAAPGAPDADDIFSFRRYKPGPRPPR